MLCGDPSIGGRTKAGLPCGNKARLQPDGTYKACYLVDANPGHVVPLKPETQVPPVTIPATPVPTTVPLTSDQRIAAVEKLLDDDVLKPETPAIVRLEYLKVKSPTRWPSSVRVTDAG